MQLPKPVSEVLQRDHERLDALLDQFSKDLSDGGAYLEFRGGLLKHIRFEETVLFKAAQHAKNGMSIELAAKLRLDHGAIAALLVPSPTPKIIQALQTVLRSHNALEEGMGGAYAECDMLLEPNAGKIIEEFKSMKPVPMAKNTDIPLAMASAGRALERAGFSPSLLS